MPSRRLFYEKKRPLPTPKPREILPIKGMISRCLKLVYIYMINQSLHISSVPSWAHLVSCFFGHIARYAPPPTPPLSGESNFAYLQKSTSDRAQTSSSELLEPPLSDIYGFLGGKNMAKWHTCKYN